MSGTLPPEPSWPRGRCLRLEGVRVRRGEAEILRGIDWTFEPGRRYVLIGPSGSGKSTLLRLLNRLEDPSGGRLLVGDVPMASLPARTVRRAVGLVFQAPRPLPGTLADNLAYPIEVRGRTRPDRDRLRDALDEVGLSPDWIDRDAALLSGGERQRLALATALMADPEILALDEPTSALDPSSARRLAAVLDRRHREAGLRTIAVSHHRGHAAWLGDITGVLVDGRLADHGPTDQVLRRHRDDGEPATGDDPSEGPARPSGESP